MKQKYFNIVFILSFIFTLSLSGQNTVGTLINSSESLNGYALFTVDKETYLINNCGEVVKQWTSDFPSGKSVYLLENGNLLRAARISNPANITIPGLGGRIELFDWDGNLIWGYDFSTDNSIQHHDIFPMPNGNILVLGTTIITDTEAIQMGRNPENLTGTELYNEQIVELKTVGTNDAEVVWQWDIKDHLIQDFDASKDNFGSVSQNPQRLDINQVGISGGGPNWLHANSIQHNADLDQIVISIRHVSEFYIIDHSTTTAESASTSGGTYQKGGDLLYRWGNPMIYGQGVASDQKLFSQHYPHWIPNGYPDEGKIILYNNGLNRTPSFSQVDIINPPTDAPGVYTYEANSAYGPFNTDYTYTAPTNTDFYSAILSSAQRLPNGNTLICEGTSAHFFEIDANEKIVWKYISPIGSIGILNQGDDPTLLANKSKSIFRVKKYTLDYAAFAGRDLTPGLPIETNPDLSQCNAALATSDVGLTGKFSLYPNPTKGIVSFTNPAAITKVEVFNTLGGFIKVPYSKNQIDLKHVPSGIYILKIYALDKMTIKRVIKL
jgi:hypothetical protein